MTHTKLIAHTLFAGFALLNLSTALKVSATPVTVTRGSHGAAVIIDSDNIPVDAKPLPKSPNHPFPELKSRGSHGASHTTESAAMNPNIQAFTAPTFATRGPHGASIIN